MSNRFVRSPPAPKMTSVHAGAFAVPEADLGVFMSCAIYRSESRVRATYSWFKKCDCRPRVRGKRADRESAVVTRSDDR